MGTRELYLQTPQQAGMRDQDYDSPPFPDNIDYVGGLVRRVLDSVEELKEKIPRPHYNYAQDVRNGIVEYFAGLPEGYVLVVKEQGKTIYRDIGNFEEISSRVEWYRTAMDARNASDKLWNKRLKTKDGTTRDWTFHVYKTIAEEVEI